MDNPWIAKAYDEVCFTREGSVIDGTCREYMLPAPVSYVEADGRLTRENAIDAVREEVLHNASMNNRRVTRIDVERRSMLHVVR